MSKEKISMQEMIDLMVKNRDITKKSSEEFIRQLLTTIEDTLVEGDSVKISGLGTFKPQWNEPRKSVDVNTGKEIVIDGYYKATFTPDTELKNLINEPFAHLEAVEINEKKPEENVTEEETDNFKPATEPMRVFEEQAEEIKGILNELGALKTRKASEDRKTETEEEINETEVNEKQLLALADEEFVNQIVEVDDFDNSQIDEETESQPIKMVGENIEAEVTTEQSELNTMRKSEVTSNDFDIIRVGGKIIYPAVNEMPFNSQFTPEIEQSDKSESETIVYSVIEEEVISETATPVISEENSGINTEPKNAELPDFGVAMPADIEPETGENNPIQRLQDEQKVENQEIASKPEVQPEQEAVPDESNYNYETEVTRKRPVWLYILLAVVLLVAVAAASAWFFSPGIFDNLKGKPKAVAAETVQKTMINPVEPVVADSLTTQSAPTETAVNVFETPRQYTEYIATEVMKRGSMLSTFAKQHLGHPYFWVYIYEANSDIIKDPNNVPLGADIKIPKMDPRLIDTNNPECLDYALRLSEKYLK